MDKPEAFVLSSDESEYGDTSDNDEVVADIAPLDAPDDIYTTHSSSSEPSVDEVLFGKLGCSTNSPHMCIVDDEENSLFSFCEIDDLNSISSAESRKIGHDEKLVSGFGERSDTEKGKKQDICQERHLMNPKLRNMTCAEVRAVMEPFFQQKEAAKMRFDEAHARLAVNMTANAENVDKKDVLERLRRLVNISNWGDGNFSKNDILLPEALLSPLSTYSSSSSGMMPANGTTENTGLHKMRYLRPHQLDGIRFMWSILAEGPVGRVPVVGCILAHTMGLGKTCQVVVFLHLFIHEQQRLAERPQRVLIVVPKSTLASWCKEIATWSQYFPLAQRIAPILIKENGDRSQRVAVYKKWWQRGGVLLVGYEMLLKLTKMIDMSAEKGWTDLLICDEAHRLKSAHLQLSETLCSLNPLRRLLLTGTPLQNHLREYWAMVDFALHKYFERKSFQEFFINPIEASAHKEARPSEVAAARMKIFTLIKELRHFVQRVDSTPLQSELPPLHEYVVVIPLSPLQVTLYNNFLRFLRMVKTKLNFLLAATYANKISAHPQLFFEANPTSLQVKENFGFTGFHSDDEYDGGGGGGIGNDRHSEPLEVMTLDNLGGGSSLMDFCKPPENYKPAPEDGAKLYIAIKIIKAAALRQEKTLFFSLSTKLLDLFENVIATMNDRWQKDGSLRRPIRFCRLDGTCSSVVRENALRLFSSADGPEVFLLSMKAGGVGITITSATRVILADSGFNPADDRQAIGRVYRYGQKKPVFVYRLLCYKTLEQRMFEQKLAKEWLFRTVVEEASLKRDALVGLRRQFMAQLYGHSWALSREAPVLTNAQKASTARLVADDSVLGSVVDDILYAEAHEVYLERDEPLQYGEEEREFYEEYQKQSVFNTQTNDNSDGRNCVERRKRQRPEREEDVVLRSRTLMTLVEDIVRNRAEENPQLWQLLRAMGVTLPVNERQEQQTTRPAAVKRPRFALTDEAKEVPKRNNNNNSRGVELSLDPSKYKLYRPGNSPQNVIFIDDDEH